MANSVKVTKRDMFNAIIAECAKNAAIVEFCQHEIEQLNKKSAKSSGKLTQTQEKNCAIKGTILDTLRQYKGKGKTISELMAENPSTLGCYSNQKLSALMRQLIEDGTVEKIVDKKKSYFAAVIFVDTEAAEAEAAESEAEPVEAEDEAPAEEEESYDDMADDPDYDYDAADAEVEA